MMAVEPIEYVGMADVSPGTMGLVTDHGIAWEGRLWQFNEAGRLSQRSAAAPRSSFEKAKAGGGTGTIMFHVDGQDWCLTTFPSRDGSLPDGSSEVRPWHCMPGWASQFFVLPACGAGPGQIRWAHNPSMCVRRAEEGSSFLRLEACTWEEAFIFKAGDALMDGRKYLRFANGDGEDDDGLDTGRQRCVHSLSGVPTPSLTGGDCESHQFFDFFR